MNAARLKSLLIPVMRLTSHQRAELLAALDAGRRGEEIGSLLDPRLIEKRICPYRRGWSLFAMAAPVGCSPTNAGPAAARLIP